MKIELNEEEADYLAAGQSLASGYVFHLLGTKEQREVSAPDVVRRINLFMSIREKLVATHGGKAIGDLAEKIKKVSR